MGNLPLTYPATALRIDIINHDSKGLVMKVTELEGLDLDYLVRVATIARDEGQSVKITQNEDGTIQITRGQGIWVGPFGKGTTED